MPISDIINIVVNWSRIMRFFVWVGGLLRRIKNAAVRLVPREKEKPYALPRFRSGANGMTLEAQLARERFERVAERLRQLTERFGWPGKPREDLPDQWHAMSEFLRKWRR